MSYRYRTTNNRPTSRHYSYKQNNRQSPRRSQKKYIDPARFVQTATADQESAYVPMHSFNDFALAPILQTNLRAKNYLSPSPIQDQAIPAALNGKDIIGIASTGTGKTAAFTLPIISRLLKNPNDKAIIVAPTRELAEQISVEIKTLSQGTRIYSALLIGGTNMGGQLRDLRQRPQLVIGTPGRIRDHASRGTLRLGTFNIVVLDEVDRMLDMGFVKDVTDILTNTSPNRQSLFFSATMDPKVSSLIHTFTSDPHTISIKASSSSANVNQDVISYTESREKISKLHDLLISKGVSKVLIFDETQRSVERLSIELNARGFSSVSIHGGKSQGQRKRALASFKNNDVAILVATDVAARGIDVADITHVINYTTPNNYEDYIHRIGRAGRAGRIGYALTFVAK